MKKEHVQLNDADRTYLQNLIKKGSLPTKTYKRALALLELNRGRTFTEVAAIVGVTKQTASTWATKYKETGLEFLTDKPRPGRPSGIEKIVALSAGLATLGSPVSALWMLSLVPRVQGATIFLYDNASPDIESDELVRRAKEAMKRIISLMTQENWEILVKNNSTYIDYHKWTAECAYEYADAMIAASENPAAAPELLEACKAALKWATADESDGGDLQTLAEIVVPMLDKAIAKAEGHE